MPLNPALPASFNSWVAAVRRLTAESCWQWLSFHFLKGLQEHQTSADTTDGKSCPLPLVWPVPVFVLWRCCCSTLTAKKDARGRLMEWTQHLQKITYFQSIVRLALSKRWKTLLQVSIHWTTTSCAVLEFQAQDTCLESVTCNRSTDCSKHSW